MFGLLARTVPVYTLHVPVEKFNDDRLGAPWRPSARMRVTSGKHHRRRLAAF